MDWVDSQLGARLRHGIRCGTYARILSTRECFHRASGCGRLLLRLVGRCPFALTRRWRMVELKAWLQRGMGWPRVLWGSGCRRLQCRLFVMVASEVRADEVVRSQGR